MRVRLAAALAVIALSVFFEAGCGDTFRPIALPIIKPGGQPQGLAHAVIVSDAGASVEGVTTHIDVAGETIVGQVTVGRGPVHANFVNSNSITVVANNGSDSLSFYSTFAPTTANPAGSVTLTAGAKPVFVFSNVASEVFVAQSGLNSVGVVSLAGTPSRIKDIAVGANPVAMVGTANGQRLYVANQNDGTVSVIDTTSNTLVPSTATLPNPINVGGAPSYLVISPDNTRIYVANKGSGTVSVIDPSTNAVTSTVTVGAAPNFLFYDVHNSRVWVTNSGGTTVSSINTGDLSVATINLATAGCVAPVPVSITVLADGTRAYVADSGCGSVSVINALSNTVSKVIPVGTTPISLDSSADSNRVVVANKGSNNVSVIGTASDTVDVTQPVAASPVWLALTK
jgi:YVTN family beta-propeller protein